jgi:general secretion pathway protein B
MSYILDALRKADAERRGVTAPAALAEPAVLVAPDDPDADLPPTPARPWVWVLGGMGVALLGVLGWQVLRGSGAPAPAPVVAAAPAVALPPPAPAPVVAPPPPAAPPPPNEDALPNFPPPLPTSAPAPAPKPEARAATPAPAPAAQPAEKAALPPGIAVVSPTPAAAPAERIYTVNELPDALRRDFPRLSVGGAMYSERAADRMVVLNGQVFHEGDALGKDLKLRQIKLKSAVLDFRGYRVEIAY